LAGGVLEDVGRPTLELTDVRILCLAVGLTLVPGCFLAPGMRMNESAAVDRGRQTTKDDQFDVRPITPDLLRRLATEASPPRLADPLAAEAAMYEYRIAPYDVLIVTVWDHPELTTPTGTFRSPEENGNRVSADGSVFYPYVGTVQVAGRTVSEVRKLLVERLNRVITNPQLDVRVAAFRGRRVQVTGEVLKPTTVPITDVPLRVQDAIALAGGFSPEADYSNVNLSRDGRVYRLNLQALYENGDLSQNWLLKEDDVINVNDRNRNKVFVVGEVRQQAARLMVKGRMTLAEALYGTGGPGVTGEIGGFEPQIANVAKIYVIRGDFLAPSIYKLDAGSADALLLASHFQLKPRDVVFVSTYEVSRWSRLMAQIVPTVTSLWQAYDVAGRPR
jgi:polysaccharide biosynthesis/export protein